ncbi:MAG TPA: bifunctional riboflavin kinase/FAD synthetase [Thermosulfurimonas dismutans]|uniref:Riboflavin biosynthesis protein n=1 Tax=Thermosulfurimonas dismutans TaxID=999894 RepID=A0A7C3GZY1_9BACT|nr:bifunctional riboflavin kinase/FAD synthetase [Thermosulfurimonas dismutans]
MKIYYPRDFPLHLKNPVATLGNFDGVHVGHQALIRETLAWADSLGGEPLVITFEPHPRKVLQPAVPLRLLTPFEEKLEFFEELGLSSVLIIPFDREVADLPAEEFVEEYLVYGLRLSGLVVGFNYRFGRGRSGDSDLLRQMGERYGFQVRVIPPQVLDGQTVSSSLIRDFLLEGKVRRGGIFLGRPYTLRGRVIRGEARGHRLGFPTANLEIPSEKLLPARGVYAVKVFFRGEGKPGLFPGGWPGVMNIGEKPTFGRHALSVEVHIFDFEGDLYGQLLEVEVLTFLRPEKKFPSPTALIQQIAKDCMQARKLLEA